MDFSIRFSYFIIALTQSHVFFNKFSTIYSWTAHMDDTWNWNCHATNTHAVCRLHYCFVCVFFFIIFLACLLKLFACFCVAHLKASNGYACVWKENKDVLIVYMVCACLHAWVSFFFFTVVLVIATYFYNCHPYGMITSHIVFVHK